MEGCSQDLCTELHVRLSKLGFSQEVVEEPVKTPRRRRRTKAEVEAADSKQTTLDDAIE